MRIELLAGYCLVIVVVSLIGGVAAMAVKLTHNRLQIVTSAIGGFMLGVALLHLLPHALEATSGATTARWMLAGMLAMFLLERFFRFHHHELVETERDPQAGHDASCDHSSSHIHIHEHRLSWSGAAVGLGLHSLIAGLALAASMEGEPEARWAGLAVFGVIVLHKPLDAITLLTLMGISGWSKTARLLVNVLFALTVPAGAAMFFLGLNGIDLEHDLVVGGAIAFSAGVFLCIALSDLLPELQFHAHDKVKLTAALLLGVAIAWAM